jgi:hypothetical protein
MIQWGERRRWLARCWTRLFSLSSILKDIAGVAMVYFYHVVVVLPALSVKIVSEYRRCNGLSFDFRNFELSSSRLLLFLGL